MKTLAALACFCLLTGCASMTPTQKRVAAVVGSALVVGAVAAHGSGSKSPELIYYAKPCPSGGAKSGVIYHC